MPPEEFDSAVLVVGGGAAGLSTAGALAKRGIASTVLERDERIGSSWTRRYRSLHLHTTRRYSGLAHFPISRDRPRYLSKNDYAAYLREYAAALALDVSLGEEVRSVRFIDDQRGERRWRVQTSRATRHANSVVLATGLYSEPVMPRWSGIEAFSGCLLHSSEYSDAAAYSGQKALIIGLGNSGAEIAADLAANGAASVAVSVRTIPPIVTREMLGCVPVQLLGIALTPLPVPRLIDRCSDWLRRFSIGDLTSFGLGRAEWGAFTSQRPAVIDTGFLDQLKQRRIVIRADLAHFDASGVVYRDGSRDAIDLVVAATGFRTGLEKIMRIPGRTDETGGPGSSSGMPTAQPGLYFVGFDETVRGQLFEINRQSRRVALDIERLLNGRAGAST